MLRIYAGGRHELYRYYYYPGARKDSLESSSHPIGDSYVHNTHSQCTVVGPTVGNGKSITTQ